MRRNFFRMRRNFSREIAKRNRRVANSLFIVGVTFLFLGFILGAVQNNTVKDNVSQDYFTSYPASSDMRG